MDSTQLKFLFDLLWISLIGGIIFLDSAPLGQWMISQPIVSAPLIGWVGGDFYSGLFIGVFLQLLWANRLPIGNSCPPEAPMLAIVTTAIIVLGEKIMGLSIHSQWYPFTILCGILAGKIGGKITESTRMYNNRFVRSTEHFSETGALEKIPRLPLLSIFFTWFLGTILIFTITGISILLIYGLTFRLPPLYYLKYFNWVLMALSMAVILDLFQAKKKIYWLVTGILVGTCLGLMNY